MTALGWQVLCDLYGCDRALLNDPVAIEAILTEAALRCGATIVSRCAHQFSPHGVSGIVVIAESHLAIHTWPEHGYAALDLFTCSALLRTDACVEYVAQALASQERTTQTIARGRPAT